LAEGITYEYRGTGCVCQERTACALSHSRSSYRGLTRIRSDAGPLFEQTRHMSKIFIRNSVTYIVHAKIKGHSCGVSSSAYHTALEAQ